MILQMLNLCIGLSGNDISAQYFAVLERVQTHSSTPSG